jgi:YD repeat-containing protein
LTVESNKNEENSDMKESCKHWLGVAILFVCHLMLATVSPVWADTYEYDDLNRLTKIIYDSGDYIKYEYDTAGNIKRAFSPDMPPVAVDDVATVTEDDPATTVTVLINDTDIDGGPQSIDTATQPPNGIVVITNDGADLTYTPAPNYCNNGTSTDDFSYTLAPGGSTATVRVTVTCVNDPPVAANDAYITDEDTMLNVSASGVLGNDSDVDGDPLAAALASGPSNGTLALNSDGSFTYSPKPNFYGKDSFTYTAVDGNGAIDTAAVNITISPVNDAPVAVDDEYVTDEDNMLDVPAPGVLDNDNDVDADTITAVLVSGPSNGTLALNSDGSFTYTPNPNYNGADSFTYTAGDNELSSGTTTVSITVNPVNDPPQVNSCIPDTQTVQYSDRIQPVIITASDIDSSSLTISAEDLPVGINSTRNCTPGNGGTSCQWTLDGQVQSGAGTYDVTVTVNDGELEHSAQASFIVEVENASAAFSDDNPVAVQVASAGGNSGEFGLTVQVSETWPDLPDDQPGAGDISHAVVSMVLMPVGPGNPVQGDCQKGLVSGEGYDAVLPATCTFDGVPVNTYAAVVSISGDYYVGGSQEVLTVYDPSLGFATGGGWFYWPGEGDKTNFGFTMIYGKKGENVKGSLLLIRHLADGTIYRVKSNALYGLSLGEGTEGQFGWASFSGKCTYLEPGWPEPEGNYEFIAYVEDRNEPGTGVDRFWLKIDKQGSTIGEMSMPQPASENTVNLNGGNIVVPHK